ncbi:snaclec coagulation factor IX/factor X-binding protein subunit A-like [Mercenaria mercenaria]|uniref:snaclec coagulation factor IX/factor X-binding protein subunit A-like n=1 Tax=Mercenaria mercenaria TaxID=6596 RepID=UPI00234F20F5|nr:snaclec coagulation factor IX/factor X-binding protein subunit A-like [Mercenaria mercenaria]
MTFFGKAMFFTVLCCIGLTKCTDCPDRWVAYHGSCYLFGHRVNQTFVEAEKFCRQHNSGHLVEIQTNSENIFLKDFLRDLGARLPMSTFRCSSCGPEKNGVTTSSTLIWLELSVYIYFTE